MFLQWTFLCELCIGGGRDVCLCESLSSVHLFHHNYKEDTAYIPSCAWSHLPMVTLLGLELQLVRAEVEFSELASGGRGHLTLSSLYSWHNVLKAKDICLWEDYKWIDGVCHLRKDLWGFLTLPEEHPKCWGAGGNRKWVLQYPLVIGKTEAGAFYWACRFLVEGGLLLLARSEVHFILLPCS